MQRPDIGECRGQERVSLAELAAKFVSRGAKPGLRGVALPLGLAKSPASAIEQRQRKADPHVERISLRRFDTVIEEFGFEIRNPLNLR